MAMLPIRRTAPGISGGAPGVFGGAPGVSGAPPGGGDPRLLGQGLDDERRKVLYGGPGGGIGRPQDDIFDDEKVGEEGAAQQTAADVIGDDDLVTRFMRWTKTPEGRRKFQAAVGKLGDAAQSGIKAAFGINKKAGILAFFRWLTSSQKDEAREAVENAQETGKPDNTDKWEDGGIDWSTPRPGEEDGGIDWSTPRPGEIDRSGRADLTRAISSAGFDRDEPDERTRAVRHYQNFPMSGTLLKPREQAWYQQQQRARRFQESLDKQRGRREEMSLINPETGLSGSGELNRMAQENLARQNEQYYATHPRKAAVRGTIGIGGTSPSGKQYYFRARPRTPKGDTITQIARLEALESRGRRDLKESIADAEFQRWGKRRTPVKGYPYAEPPK